jgi:hypothetical protein
MSGVFDLIREHKSSHTFGDYIPKTPIDIFYKSHSGTPKVFSLPDNNHDTESTLTDLLSVCDDAVFGHGFKEVKDYSIRKASSLKASRFAIKATDIIPDIEQQIGNYFAGSISLKLDKLNIYGPDGLFKVHKDTPTHQSMIGTIVVCLPSEFEGGEFVIHHKNAEEVVHKWAIKSATHVQFAAFYADVDHEVRRVTQGHRVTISYSVYRNIHERANDTPCPVLSKKFELAFSDPFFFHHGFKIAYPCEFMYSSSNNRLLKGHDAIVFNTFKSLGMTPTLQCIVPVDSDIVVEEEIEANLNGNDVDCIDNNDLVLCAAYSVPDYYEYVKQMFIDRLSKTNIRFRYTNNAQSDQDSHSGWDDIFGDDSLIKAAWIKNPLESSPTVCVGVASFVYGNYPASKENVYKSYAIIAQIPSFKNRAIVIAKQFMEIWRNPLHEAKVLIRRYVPKDVGKLIAELYIHINTQRFTES